MKAPQITAAIALCLTFLICPKSLSQSPTPAPSAVPFPPTPDQTVAPATSFDPRFTKISQEATPDPVLRFEYRLWPDAKVVETTVEADGRAIPATATPFAENPLNKSALLLLVDTSLGKAPYVRNRTIEENKKAILDIANLATPRTGLGLYSFANDLAELAPLASPASQIRASLPRLRADGMGTRIALSSRAAIRKLGAYPAERQAIVIFSDGKEEDSGYNWSDLRTAADQAGVMVMAIGCPETSADIPGLGALQKLADETKGYYAQMVLPTNASRGGPQNLPGLPQAILQSLDGGGEVVADLRNVATNAKVTVRLKTESGQVLEKELVRAPAPAASPSGSPSPGTNALVRPSPTGAVAPEVKPEWWKAVFSEQNRMWLIVAGAALLFLLLILVRLLLRRGSSPSPEIEPVNLSADKTTRAGSASSAKGAPLAYLSLQDANSTRMPISKTATRIGRRSDNDIVFSNDSVSGHHAEIHMGRDGSFNITDLNSGNGVHVNGAKVQQSGLRDGDSVDLGEVRFRFSLAK